MFVHIADVSYYVVEGTALDEEALRRTTSVYVSTGVEPMLPPLLSSGVCSLQPGVDRKTVTVEMHVDAGGRVEQVRFFRSIIRSDRRLTYDELEAVLHGDSTVDAELAEALALGRPLAALLRERRFDQGSLRITSTEPEFHWSDAGDLLSAHAAEELESHRFIEEYMILANEQVATFLERKRAPTVYRVHDMPDPFRVDHLLDVLASLDVPTPPFDPMLATATEVRRVAREMSEYLDRNVPRNRGRVALVQQVLRAQARAVYQTENIGHFGLALGTYCHFTSPIRRYPDLLVHRGLLADWVSGPTPRRRPWPSGPSTARGRSGRRPRSNARPTTSPWPTCCGGVWTETAGAPSSRARSSAWCPPAPSCSSSSCSRASCRPANCQATTTS